MSGFDLSSLLPIYLDEADDQIAALNDRLLRLEEVPGDEAAIRDAFRQIHTLKGSSTMLGFDQVKGLTHHLETIFDQFRNGKRRLDRTFLDLCFRCLDGLRDYHAGLRAEGHSDVDLSELTAVVLHYLEDEPEAGAETVLPSPVREPIGREPEKPADLGPIDPEPDSVCVTLTFEPNLPWPDMKAKLVLNRLGEKGQVLSTEPSVDQLEDVKPLPRFRVWLKTTCEFSELHAVSDVDGVTNIQIDTIAEGELPASDPPSVLEPVAAPRDESTTPVSPTFRSDPDAPKSEPARPPDSPAPRVDPAPAETKRVRTGETIRVDVDRLDSLMNLAGELVINKSRFLDILKHLDELFRASNGRSLATDTLNRLEEISAGLEARDEKVGIGSGVRERWAAQLRRVRENFRTIREELDLIRRGREHLSEMADAIHHLSSVSDGIQRGVLETRMVPIGPLFDRFQRVVRDLRNASNKEVLLRVEGEKTELDKRMIDELGDPLIHLVRNAVDHGLESPDQREAAGKRRMGTVKLSASQRGNSVVISVTDDGRGIDTERVRRKAIARGLVDEETANRLDDRQVIQFIWHPGLSTAESITDISGRGVGMDIVKSRIESLNGSVDVRSEPRFGTTFFVRLPLTLAIISVLLTKAAGETYAIPLDHLDEIVEVRPAQIYYWQGHASIEIRGRIVSIISLKAILHGREPSRTLNESVTDENAKLTVVIISNGEGTLGLIVEELLGMHEAVLKSLERHFRTIRGLSGASILGDGRVSLILDVDAVIDMVGDSSPSSRRIGSSRPASGPIHTYREASPT